MSRQDDLLLRSCLDLSVQMLALRRDLNDLTARVDRMNAPRAVRVTGSLVKAAKFFETKLGQAILAIGTPVIAAILKWLLGGS